MLRADAIAVLGCTVRVGGLPTPALERRIALAARAYREGVARRIVASGGRRWHGHVEALVIESGLRQCGVDADSIDLELCSLSTVENALFCSKLLPPRSTVLVATCVAHLPRAVAAFRRFGMNASAPPECWFGEPAPSYPTRLRERVCALIDSVRMGRAT